MEFFKVIMGRRSIRAFKPKAIPQEYLYKILEAGRWAPSAGNCQARDLLIIDDAKIKSLLCKATFNQNFIEEAPIIIIVCANERKSAERYGARGKDLYCILDASAAIENIILAAYALNLGSCWISAFNDNEVIKILNLPIWLRPIGIIPIGYPNERPIATTRIPLERLLHKNRFNIDVNFNSTLHLDYNLQDL